jgi:hypothetical protein
VFCKEHCSGGSSVLGEAVGWSKQCSGESRVLVGAVFWGKQWAGRSSVLVKAVFWWKQCSGQPRTQALSTTRLAGGKTLVQAGHVSPRFWEITIGTYGG